MEIPKSIPLRCLEILSILRNIIHRNRQIRRTKTVPAGTLLKRILLKRILLAVILLKILPKTTLLKKILLRRMLVMILRI